MGLLDDAIREHLDLKRRHGADPAEIERAEREALGPVRRGPEGSPDSAFESAVGIEEELAPAHEPGEQWFEPFDHEATEVPHESGREAPRAPRGDTLADEAFATVEDPFAAESRFRTDEEQFSPLDEGPLEPGRDEELGPGRSGRGVTPPHPAQPPPRDHLGQETAEYDVEGELRHPDHASDDDVLEETPEFLQDTPDHDRLWFEQRPPRDFDFEE